MLAVCDRDEAEPPGEPCFDPGLGAWVVSRHADVSAALRDPRLAVSDLGDGGAAAHAAVREAAAQAVAPARLAGWRGELEASARALIARLPAGVPVDLVASVARPWSTALAGLVTRTAPTEAARLDTLARAIFLEAARATGPGSHPSAEAAVAELANRFAGAAASADVQAYVALSQTLPGLLAGAWLELSRRPDEADRLRVHPALMPGAVEELLRHAGPSRAVFRRAAARMAIGGASISPGDRVILMLWAANHDPARFPEPGRLDVRRDAAGHLAFGAGPHSCPGAPLIRMAVAVATAALLEATRRVELAGEVEWIDGFAIRVPASLPVVCDGSARQRADRG